MLVRHDSRACCLFGTRMTCLLLCRDANRVNEEWFADEESVRSKVGLLDDAPVASTSGKVGPKVSATEQGCCCVLRTACNKDHMNYSCFYMC